MSGPVASPDLGGASPLRPALPEASVQAPPPAAIAPAQPRSPIGSRWSGYAYLFGRTDRGGAATLAPAGQIGGSQAAARIAYRVDDDGRIALAARLASPLADRDAAEAAAGIDLVPLPGLRLSVERRAALGRGGRDAFAAYAAGGVYRALGHGVELDGYAQAGIVGVRRHDPFADGAVRLHHRQTVASGTDLRIGGVMAAAAQPGAARLDLGPRIAVTTRTPRLPITIAIEGRLRVAGRARPGDGIALTLATDF